MIECIDNEFLAYWLNHYGSFALFALLALGIVALPIPDETLIIVAGGLIHTKILAYFPTILAVYLGAMTGITLSYLIGRACGKFVILKHGKWIGLTEAKYTKAHAWFDKYGVWLLFFGYFIPGVRHFTGIIAGTVDIEYKHFALFAYCGAFIWATVFLLVGYFFGGYCFPVDF